MSKIENKFQKGDIIVETYSYNGTSVNFYEVVGTTPASVELRELKQEGEGNYSGFCWPVAGSYKGESTNKYRLNKNGNPNIDKYTYARAWNGKPVWWNSGYECGQKAKYDEDREIYKKYATK